MHRFPLTIQLQKTPNVSWDNYVHATFSILWLLKVIIISFRSPVWNSMSADNSRVLRCQKMRIVKFRAVKLDCDQHVKATSGKSLLQRNNIICKMQRIHLRAGDNYEIATVLSLRVSWSLTHAPPLFQLNCTVHIIVLCILLTENIADGINPLSHAIMIATGACHNRQSVFCSFRVEEQRNHSADAIIIRLKKSTPIYECHPLFPQTKVPFFHF